ncbi:unnamed protein product [Clonostachys rosea]|uniref:Uncharacterized protein n=1 Tax=Bionectria ochroleuca TaxID=29856 RepID=A0ABY6U7N5_BIOOC|nr:unnamed protein product [Clonostachys rosea]
MSESPEFNELHELHLDLEALKEDLEERIKELENLLLDMAELVTRQQYLDGLEDNEPSMREKENEIGSEIVQQDIQINGKKEEIKDKKEEIEDKKKEIKVEESMTEEQIRERGIKSYRQ